MEKRFDFVRIIKDFVRSEKFVAAVAAVLLFFALGYLYCSPVLQGQTLGGGDDTRWRSAVQECSQYRAETGEQSWWTRSMFSGMPNYQIGGADYKSQKILSPVLKLTVMNYNPARQIAFYFLGFYLLFLAFGVGPWLSIVAAIGTGLSSYFLIILPAGHSTKALTIASTAFVIAGFKFIFDKKYAAGIILTMVFVSLGFNRHPQMFYYFCMLMGVMWLAELWIHLNEKRVKDLVISTVIFALCLGIGVGTRMSNVFANAEYVSQTTRGSEKSGPKDESTEVEDDAEAAHGSRSGLDIRYALSFSYGIDETLSLMIPGIKGGSTGVRSPKNGYLAKGLTRMGVNKETVSSAVSRAPLYWGEQPFTEGNVYVGAAICFLFLLGLLVVEGPYKWALLAATLFSIFLAWGSNMMWLSKLFYKYFPLYNKFRAVSSILVVAEVTMPLLAFMAVRDIIAGKVEGKKLMRSVLISAGVTVGICLVMALLSGSIYDFKGHADAKRILHNGEAFAKVVYGARHAMLVGDCIRSSVFILLAAASIWLFTKLKKNAKAFLIIALAAIVITDLWNVDRRYFNKSNFHTYAANTEDFSMTDYEKTILQDKSDFRVCNLLANPFSDARTSYYLKSIGGYSAAKLRRYDDIIHRYLSSGNPNVLAMLNTKYLIVNGENGPEVKVNKPYGNAWYVDVIESAKNQAEELDAIGRFNLKHVAVVGNDFKDYVKNPKPIAAPDAKVELVSVTPKSQGYRCLSSRAGTIVFSEIYYPYGWRAYIDGKPAEYFRANYTLRAINVPAGKHTIIFNFDPISIKKGDTIASVFIILMYLIIAGLIGWSVWRRLSVSRKG